jgi:signal transduction histidine kinase
VATGDERVYRIVALPFPKLRTESLDELPVPVEDAIRSRYPDAVYIRARHESLRGRSVREIELVDGYRFLEIKVTPEGEAVEEDSIGLPQSLPQRVVESFFGVRPAADNVPVSWTAHDFQLLMVVPLSEDRKAVVNRYLEYFQIGPNGEISGPTEESALRLLVATDVTHVELALAGLLWRLVVGGTVVWLLIVAIGWLGIRRAFLPVRRILDAANSIEPAHLDARLPRGKVEDELYAIAETINRMLDRLEKGFRREKRFTGDASHELRGPLAKIIAEIDVALASDRPPTEYRHALERCRRYASGLQGIVESLLLLTRLDRQSEAVGSEAVDIQTVVVDSVRAIPDNEGRRVRLDLWRGKAPLLVRGSSELLGVLVRNLLENALRYSPSEERVEARVLLLGSSVTLEIEDHGAGVPDEAQERVFDRFFRLDGSRARGTGGVGLGLSIVRSIARAHGGDVLLGSSNGEGTLARVTLPAVDSP